MSRASRPRRYGSSRVGFIVWLPQEIPSVRYLYHFLTSVNLPEVSFWECSMYLSFKVLAGLSAMALLSMFSTARISVQAAPFPAGYLPRPHPFAVSYDGASFSQVAMVSTSAAADGGAPGGVDMKLAHVASNNAANIKSPSPGSSYSYSIGAYTTTGYWLQMGYMVLGSDGDGLARWFVQVLDRNGALVEWKLSRAGEANPPPACSACSGGSTDGYPFAFTATAKGEWTFWFDGITKDRVRLTANDVALDSTRGIYYMAEVTAAKSASEVMGPRTSLRTLSLWSSRSRTWVEAAHATAVYASSDGQRNCVQYGAQNAGTYTAGNYPGVAHSIIAGSGINCGSVGW